GYTGVIQGHPIEIASIKSLQKMSVTMQNNNRFGQRTINLSSSP
ncbi:hypothetical protein CEXT_576491, partial [Caerostris extrusa]